MLVSVDADAVAVLIESPGEGTRLALVDLGTPRLEDEDGFGRMGRG